MRHRTSQSRGRASVVEALEPRCLRDGTPVGVSLDATFGAGGLVTTDFNAGDDRGRAVVLQPDGRAVLVGVHIRAATGTATLAATRYNADGSVDGGYGSGGKVVANFAGGTFVARSAVLAPDGGVLVGGTDADQFALAKITAGGTIDTTFGNGGEVRTALSASNVARAVLYQPDGKILVGGDSAVVRYNADGSLDTTFGYGTGATQFGYGPIKAMALAPDGSVLVAGNDGGGGLVARFTPDGRFDTGFFAFSNFSPDRQAGEFRALAVTPDGHVVAAGVTEKIDGTKRDAIVCEFNADGTVDADFGTNGVAIVSPSTNGDDVANALSIGLDGSIVGVGTAVPGTATTAKFAVFRLTADGVLDAGFGVGGETTASFPAAAGAASSGGPQRAFAVALQPDGKILVGGFAHGDFALARFDVDFASLNAGTLDVVGTAAADAITVNADAVAGTYTATLNGQTLSFPLADVKAIQVVAGAGDDAVSIAGSAPASILGGEGNDSLVGGTGADTIAGAGGADSILGSDGADLLRGGLGPDTIKGGTGEDDIIGGKGGDQLFGGAGADQIHGARGPDNLTGGGGPDTLFGGPGTDTLRGAGGADSLVGGIGPDSMLGGGGDDAFAARDAEADSIDGGAGANAAQIDAGLDTLTAVQTLLA